MVWVNANILVNKFRYCLIEGRDRTRPKYGSNNYFSKFAIFGNYSLIE